MQQLYCVAWVLAVGHHQTIIIEDAAMGEWHGRE